MNYLTRFILLPITFLAVFAGQLQLAMATYTEPLVLIYDVVSDHVNDVDTVLVYFYNNAGTNFEISAVNIGIRFDNNEVSIAGVSNQPSYDDINSQFNGIFGFNYQINVAELASDVTNYATHNSRYWYSNSVFAAGGGSNVSMTDGLGPQLLMKVAFQRLTPGVAGHFYLETVDDFAGLNFNDGSSNNLAYETDVLSFTSLPVELLEFTAKPAGEKSALLQWSTSVESNSSTFDVERSQDSRLFKKVGSLKAAGNSNEVNTYAFVDEPVSGRLYYRLRQVDIDGSFVYSEVVDVLISGAIEPELNLYPNPATEFLNVQMNVSGTSKFQLTIYDQLGKIHLIRHHVKFEQASLNLDLPKLLAGTYILQLVSEDQAIQTSKIFHINN
ncbi:MAG: T9SS type A sorting domain-containing protein [Bacteroidia bacterium]|nr:T9SS type A sorting domain-containing protein [Bacteroidia bacterium]